MASDMATITLHVSAATKRRADKAFAAEGTTTAKALTNYLENEYGNDEHCVTEEPEWLVSELLERVKDAEAHPENTMTIDEVRAKLSEELKIDV